MLFHSTLEPHFFGEEKHVFYSISHLYTKPDAKIDRDIHSTPFKISKQESKCNDADIKTIND